jgi:hypothetical protein
MAAADDLYDLPPGVDLPLAAATPRCWPSIDEVATDGARRGAVIVCLDWANGRCAAGIGCAARHALPSIADENRMAHSADGLLCDIFGRPRAPASETPLSVFDPLACSTIHIVSGMPPGDQHERRRALDESLSEWGQVVKSWFLADTRSCFVKFKWRSTAQLVLEALQGRPLRPEDNEPLELAWATVDPSIVQARQGRELAYSAMREARERGRATQALYDRLEREKGGGAAAAASALGKRPREHRDADDDSTAWDDDAERLSAVATAYPGGHEAADGGEQVHDDAPAERGAEAAAPAGEEELPAGWRTALDETYGVAYFYHADGRTQWEYPRE